jgi:cell division protein FtsZ
MSGMGDALMGTGVAEGENRAAEAARMALSSPLLDDISIRGAKGVLVNITGNEKMTLHEVSQATAIISEEAGEDANVIFGAVVNPEETGAICVTVIATGFEPVEREIHPDYEARRRTAVHAQGMGADRMKVDTPAVAVEETVQRADNEPGMDFVAAGVTTVAHELNLDIPTFLRKQLD